MRYLFWTLALSTAFAQPPATFLNLESISSDHKITVVNTGPKPIGAYTVQNLVDGSEWKGWVGSVLLLDPPLQPGESHSYGVWPEVTQLAHIRIAAIIFADGTHTGHVKDTLCGKDVIACIFEGRKGLADGYAQLVKETSGESFAQMTSHLTAPGTRHIIPLTKALANQTQHDRAMRSVGEMHEGAVREKQANVQAGKLTPAAAQQEIAATLQKAAQFWEERAIDNGDVQ